MRIFAFLQRTEDAGAEREDAVAVALEELLERGLVAAADKNDETLVRKPRELALRRWTSSRGGSEHDGILGSRSGPGKPLRAKRTPAGPDRQEVVQPGHRCSDGRLPEGLRALRTRVAELVRSQLFFLHSPTFGALMRLNLVTATGAAT